MKKIYLILLSGFLFTACNKDFLERYPTSSVSPPTFFTSENDFKIYTNQFYNFLPGGTDVFGETADNIVKSSLDPEVAGTRLLPETDSKWNWEKLRAINFLLTSSNAINYKDATIRDKYMGMARFFRAMFYFEKVRLYGDVPWYNHVIESGDSISLKKARDPRTLIMDSVLADINFAIEKMDATKSVERITRYTALALKSRICLYEGTWRKYHTEFNLPDAEKFLNECVSASETLMNSGAYQLYTKTTGPTGKPYQDLFATLTIDPVADEVILGRRYSAELNIRHGLQFYMTSRTQGKPGLEKKLVNSYLMNDGSRFTDIPGYDTMQYLNEIQNRDPRLAQTIRTPGYTRIGQTAVLSPDFQTTMTGYQPTKWLNVTTYDGSGQSVNDLLLFRLGEVLLNYAEAKAELGTITQQDINNSIKLLRDRVGMPNLDIIDANTNPDPYQAAMYNNISSTNKGLLIEIRRERRIELVMENDLRWEDLMRWKEGHLMAIPFRGAYFPAAGLYDLDKNGTVDLEIYSGAKPPEASYYQLPVSDLTEGTKGNILVLKNITKKFDENRDYLWPIPLGQIAQNNNLSQNPNWK